MLRKWGLREPKAGGLVEISTLTRTESPSCMECRQVRRLVTRLKDKASSRPRGGPSGRAQTVRVGEVVRNR